MSQNDLFTGYTEALEQFFSRGRGANEAKSGYEIRTQLLGLATDISLSEYKAKFDVWTKQVDLGHSISATVPVPPGVAEVLEIAKQLNEFVNNKK